MPLQIADVVADAADAELAEVGEVFANLRGVQVELLGERLRRNRPDAGALEQIEAAQVHRQTVRGELGDLIDVLLGFEPDRGFVRRFHKRSPIVAKRRGRRSTALPTAVVAGASQIATGPGSRC